MSFMVKFLLLCVSLPSFYGKYLIEIETENPIQFAIYYDTESKASIDWFEKDFKANYKTFESFLQYDYVPCNEITIASDKKTISCPGTDKTCYMNKLHACAADQMKGGAKLNEFITCTLENKQDPLTKCVGGDQALMKTLDECAKGDKGLKLCIDVWNTMPPFEQFPSFIGDFFYKLPFDMVDLLCKMLKLHTGKCPDVCGKPN